MMYLSIRQRIEETGANMNKEDCKKVFIKQYKIYQKLHMKEEPNVYECALNLGVYLGMQDMMVRSGQFTLEEIDEIKKSAK